MSKVVITFEDSILTGRVKVVCQPSFETMMMKNRSGSVLTAAEGYAVAALRRVMEAEKEQGPLKVLIPKVGRA